MTHRPGFQPIQQIMQRSQPKQQALWDTAIAHLTRDREQGRLTLTGPALAYYALYADPGDPLRDWVLAQVDARIAATVEARLGGAKITDRHVCQVCSGKGMDYHKELCEPCGGIGLVCPICTGSRWTTDGRPDRHPDQAKVTACPGCMTATSTGYRYDHAKAQRTIQAHIDRPYSPPRNVRDADLGAAYARAEATAKERRERPPEAPDPPRRRRRRTT